MFDPLESFKMRLLLVVRKSVHEAVQASTIQENHKIQELEQSVRSLRRESLELMEQLSIQKGLNTKLKNQLWKALAEEKVRIVKRR